MGRFFTSGCQHPLKTWRIPMKNIAPLALSAVVLLTLTACYSGRPTTYRTTTTTYDTSPRSTYGAYYTGYYGPYTSGYWANDGYFYYRDRHNNYRRDDRRHFRRDPFTGGVGVQVETR